MHVDIIWINTKPALGDQQIGYDDAGALTLVNQVEQLRHGIERVQAVLGGDDQPLEITLACAEDLPQVPLLRLGGYTGGGTCTLNVNEDHWNFHHPGAANRFSHQREPSAGGCAHGPAACVGCANGHVSDSNLILYLADHDPQGARISGHPVEDPSRGAHGIGGIKLDPSRGATHGQGIVSSPDRQWFGASRSRSRERLKVCVCVVEAGTGNSYVLVDHGLTPSLEPQR